jgi:hypothetical protein
MNASFHQSSNTDGLIYFHAKAHTILPALSPPVKLIPLMAL